jgi:hypothetical protein
MFGGQHPRPLIEAMYAANGRNFERTLEQCLAGQVPKDELKVVVVAAPEKPKETEYLLGAFTGSSARRNKNRRYYEDHMRAVEQQKRQEEEDNKEVRKKMLHLASIMQYEDDFDDQNFYSNKNKRAAVESSSSDSEEPPRRQADDDDEEEGDVDIELIIERHESSDPTKMDYQFQDE